MVRRPRLPWSRPRPRAEEPASETVDVVPDEVHVVDEDSPLVRRQPGDDRPLVPQPVLAMRTRPHLNMITTGLVFALLGAASIVASSGTRLRLTEQNPILPAVGNVGAVLGALVAFVQWRLWTLALREWEGVKDVGLSGWLNVSATGVWVSVISTGAVAVSSWSTLADTTRSETSWWLALVGTVFVILGCALAGSHRFLPDGPSGVPTHIRRNRAQHQAWLEAQDRQRDLSGN